MGGICKKRFPKEIKMLILGIEGSGKTKLLYQLKYDRNVLTIPTLGFNVEILKIDDAKFLTFDLGRFDSGNHKEFYEKTDIVMFVVDSADDNKFYEAKLRLHNVMEDEELQNAYLLVIANKQDLPESLNTKEISTKLSLKEINQDWSVMGAIANCIKDPKSNEISQEENLIKQIKNFLLTHALDKFVYNKQEHIEEEEKSPEDENDGDLIDEDYDDDKYDKRYDDYK